MVRPLREYFGDVIGTDILDYRGPRSPGNLARDFLFDHDRPPVDWIITNPPFKLAERFIATAITSARIGTAMLVRSAFLEGVNRFHTLFQDTPPTDVLQFCERVVMFRGRLVQAGASYWSDSDSRMKTASSATSYVWLIWEKDRRGHRTRFDWITPCRDRLERPGDYPPPPQPPLTDTPLEV